MVNIKNEEITKILTISDSKIKFITKSIHPVYGECLITKNFGNLYNDNKIKFGLLINKKK